MKLPDGAPPCWQRSVTQSALLPGQTSGASQGFALCRHTVSGPRKPSFGHEPLVPVQLSATSHTPATGRQVVVEDLKPSTQVLAVPLQESVPSQAPPLELPTQVVVADANPSAGHAPDVPLQLSATSH